MLKSAAFIIKNLALAGIRRPITGFKFFFDTNLITLAGTEKDCFHIASWHFAFQLVRIPVPDFLDGRYCKGTIRTAFG
jgi:hypothetical protein